MDRRLRADGSALSAEAVGRPEAVPPVLARLALGDWLALTDMGLPVRMAREGLAEPERGFPRLGSLHRTGPGPVR
jgi:hypothetical protein